MITYVYETVPATPDEKSERFEWRQSIREPALENHPETGAPVRRVVSGGLGFTSSAEGNESAAAARALAGVEPLLAVRNSAPASRNGTFLFQYGPAWRPNTPVIINQKHPLTQFTCIIG